MNQKPPSQNRRRRSSSRNENRNRDRRHRNRNQSQKKPVFTNRISEHFQKKDFECRHCRELGEGKVAFRISLGLVGGLEMLRSHINKKIIVNKAYVCPDGAELESKIRRNFYATGIAAQIQAEDMSLQDLFKAAEEIPEFMGIGLNLDTNSVHVDTRKSDERALWVEHHDKVTDLTDDVRAVYHLS